MTRTSLYVNSRQFIKIKITIFSVIFSSAAKIKHLFLVIDKTSISQTGIVPFVATPKKVKNRFYNIKIIN